MAPCYLAEAVGFPIFQVFADLLRPCLHAQVCKGWMQELVLHVPVDAWVPAFDALSTSPYLCPNSQWLLQPIPRGLRIAGLASVVDTVLPAEERQCPRMVFHATFTATEHLEHSAVEHSVPRLPSHAQAFTAHHVI